MFEKRLQTPCAYLAMGLLTGILFACAYNVCSHYFYSNDDGTPNSNSMLKEMFQILPFSSYYKDSYGEGNYIPDEPMLLSQKTHQYTTIPYSMEFTKSIGKRGCEADSYSKCVMRHQVSENDVPEEIQKACESESNAECCFPDLVTQSRTEPYYMYSQYV